MRTKRSTRERNGWIRYDEVSKQFKCVKERGEAVVVTESMERTAGSGMNAPKGVARRGGV